MAPLLPAGDCNQNGLPDQDDIQAGTSRDCNENGLPDECDVSPRDFGFERGASVDIGPRPAGFELADLDGDAEPDLVLVVRDAEETLLRKGLGGFAFAEPTPLPLDVYQPSIALGDFDGDGDLDLAASGSRSSQVVRLENDGSGGFAPDLTFELAGQPTLLAADVDGDGDVDLCTRDLASSVFLHIFLSDGLGGVEDRQDRFLSNSPVQGFLAADFDGDGGTDLGFRADGGGLVLIGGREPDGNGGTVPSFSNEVRFQFDGEEPIAADVDGDGHLDFVGASVMDDALHVSFNRGGGVFHGTAAVVMEKDPSAVIAADFDFNGSQDLAVAYRPYPRIDILRNKGDGRLLKAITLTADEGLYGMKALDADSDGNADILAGVSDFLTEAHIAVLHNKSERSFAKDCDQDGILDECGVDCDGDGVPDTCAIAAGAPDLDQNGRPDACDVDCNGNGSPDGVDLASGASRDCNQNGIPDECDLVPSFGFPGPTRLEVSGSGTSMAAVDVDGDGDLDIASAATLSSEVEVLLNHGNRTFETPRAFAGRPPARGHCGGGMSTATRTSTSSSRTRESPRRPCSGMMVTGASRSVPRSRPGTGPRT
jgi:hypothetical protein